MATESFTRETILTEEMADSLIKQLKNNPQPIEYIDVETKIKDGRELIKKLVKDLADKTKDRRDNLNNNIDLNIKDNVWNEEYKDIENYIISMIMEE